MDVVTGGAGFIGSHICRALLAQGRTVRIIDNLSTGRLSNISDICQEYGKRVEFVEADIRNAGQLEGLLKGCRVVYHQAAIPSVQRSVEDPLASNDANVNGTLHLFLAARDAGVRKVVYASSSSIYGDSESLPKEEAMQPIPISPYGVTKFVKELYGRVFASVFDLSNVGLRYFNVFGPFQDPTSEYSAVIPRFITRMLAGQPPIIYGDGEQSRDFTYVDNVVEANLGAALSAASGISLNVACGSSFTLNQLISVLNEILGTSFEPIYQDPRPGDIRHSLAAVSRAQAEIGYRVSISFEEGLERTVDWFRKNA